MALSLATFYWKESALGRGGGREFLVCMEKQNMMKHFFSHLKVQSGSPLQGTEGLVCSVAGRMREWLV
jgi:hypothetical protein